MAIYSSNKIWNNSIGRLIKIENGFFFDKNDTSLLNRWFYDSKTSEFVQIVDRVMVGVCGGKKVYNAVIETTDGKCTRDWAQLLGKELFW